MIDLLVEVRDLQLSLHIDVVLNIIAGILSLAACRFWDINTKQERKIASRDTIIVSRPKETGPTACPPATGCSKRSRSQTTPR